MNIETLKKEYDFTESRIIETSWARGFRDFILKVDYYWDRDSTVISMPGPKQLMLIYLHNCVWVQFFRPQYCQSTDMVTQMLSNSGLMSRRLHKMKNCPSQARTNTFCSSRG
jgi:hypothetical protein